MAGELRAKYRDKDSVKLFEAEFKLKPRTAIDVEIDIRVEMGFDRMQRRAGALSKATTELRGALGPSR